MTWQWRIMQNLKRNWLVNSKFDMRKLANFDWSTFFDGLFLTKIYNIWPKKVQRSYVWWHWTLMQNLKENWLMLSKMTWRIWQISAHRLKNSSFILESKMVEINKNKNPKQADQPDAVLRLYFTLKINEQYN